MTRLKYFGLAVFAVHACYMQGYVTGDCIDGWLYYEKSCYLVGHTDLTFIEAEKFCTHYSAHLVTVDSAFDNNFIRSILLDLKDPNHWIGLTDEIVDGDWRWQSNNNATSFTNWSPGEPNGSKTENCVVIWAAVNYRWVDAPCTDRYKALCEMPSDGGRVIVG